MSPGKDHEYFSDGLSEELLNMLAKMPELKVIARTSAFSFKEKNEDIRSIAKKLGVAHIFEKVLSIEPGHVDALLRLANLARYKGRPQEAVKLTSQAIS